MIRSLLCLAVAVVLVSIVSGRVDSQSRCDFNGEETLKDLSLLPQEGPEWCWAATGQMIMEFGDRGTSYPQCEQADKVFGRSDCCANQRPSNCDRPAWPPFYSPPEYTFDAQYTDDGGNVAWELLATQICQGQPISASWRYPWGGGHMRVVKGYLVKNGQKLVEVVDPCGDSVDVDCVATRYFMNFNMEYIDDLIGGTGATHWYDIYDIAVGPTTLGPDK